MDPGKLIDRINLSRFLNRPDAERLTGALNRRRMKKITTAVVLVFALIGVAAVVASIAFLIHHYLTPAYTDDFEDDFEDFEDEDADI